MSGRGHGQGPRGPGRGAGRGRYTPPMAQMKNTREPAESRASNHQLRSYCENKQADRVSSADGGTQDNNLQTINLSCILDHTTYLRRWRRGAGHARRNLSWKVIMSQFLSDQKDWKTDSKAIVEKKQSVFALVYAQLSESSRDDEDWTESYQARDLLYLIQRIRATLIARQSGNPGQDRDRVRMAWATIRM